MAERPIERWTQLRNVGTGDGTLEVPSISSGIETGFGPIRFAVGPDGQPRLLVPCGLGGTLTGERSTGKLVVNLSRYTLGGRATVFVDIMSVDKTLDTVFAELADEILHRVDGGEAPTIAVEGTIADFQDLLRDDSKQDVSDAQILGLIGELVVLRELGRISPLAVEAWTGPYEQRHDFRRREHALEVKTSARSDTTTVSISSCDQLAEPSGGSLVLVHVNVERSHQGILSVASLVSEISELGVARTQLEKGLAALGCLDSLSEGWNRISCGLEGISAYRVTEGFPRITSALFPGGVLPDGIDSIAYTVDLRSAKDFILSDGDRCTAFSRIVE